MTTKKKTKLEMLTKDAILAADDLPMEWMDAPEWGGGFYLRLMSGRERDAFEVDCTVDGEVTKENIRAKLIVRTACDDKRNRIFNNADADDLGEKSGAVLGRAWKISATLNGISDDDVEELAGN